MVPGFSSRIPDRTASLDVSLKRAHSAHEPEGCGECLRESAMIYVVLHHERRRDKGGYVSHRHGNLRVGTLRKMYGQSFDNRLTESL
jgi:hypothetical protein